MSNLCESKKSKIQRIFNTMEYDISTEVPPQEYTEIKKEYDNDLYWEDLKPLERCEKLNLLADEIENNTATFSKLMKGDTEKNVQLLVQYIIYYTNFYTKCDDECTVSKFAIFIAESGTPLWSLGAFLGPALISGYEVTLEILDKELLNCALFLRDLAEKIGIPSETIHIQNNLRGINVLYWKGVVTVFGDLRREIYKKYPGKILNLAPLRTPLLIFEGADLDSAIECITNSVQTVHLMKPWSVHTILVQENIFKTFEAKFKNSNISVNDKLSTNKVLTCDNIPDNSVNILTFRTIDEGVNLANNGRQGFAASVWIENLSLVNEVARKLKVSNVWVNSFGLISPDVPFSPLKGSGTGYFGGIEGFYEYSNVNFAPESCSAKNENFKTNLNIINAVNAAKKAQEVWERVSTINRMKIFQKIARSLSDEASKNIIYECISSQNKLNYNSTSTGYMVTSLRTPRGILAVELYGKNNFELVILALFEGNAVILLNNQTKFDSLYKEIAKSLPNNILTVFPYTVENSKTVASHNELNAYLADGTNSERFLQLSKVVSQEKEDIIRNVTAVKNIWTTVGASSQCVL